MSIQPIDESRMQVNQPRSITGEYLPLAYEYFPDAWSLESGYVPMCTIPLAESKQPAHEVVATDISNQGDRPELPASPYEDYLQRLIQNMPTYLLRTAAMDLVSKADVLSEILPKISPATPSTWKVARFAILSHRWGAGELTFHDMRGKPDHDMLRETRAGFHKVEQFCRIARLHGCDWAWSDTCCIDKTSSAELDEAIRSMYRWYQHAAICIVHLADIVFLDALADDAWFTRGWTLQELLAPHRVKFFNKTWYPLTSDQNDKGWESTLLQLLSDITAIPRRDISHFRVGTDRIVEKMTWAAKRTTTRIEDVAYSLIGIFDVSMAIMYGEGARAFSRLQLALAEQTNTTELFLWQGAPSDVNSMLAPKPQSFVTQDKTFPMEFTADEVKQFAPRDIWRLIASIIKPYPNTASSEVPIQLTCMWLRPWTLKGQNQHLQRSQQVRPSFLEGMETETLQRIGPGHLRRMDGETLRRTLPVLLAKHSELEGLLDDATRERLKRDPFKLSPWGGQQYMMTGAGLAIDVVLYDVQMIEPSNSVDPEDPFVVHFPAGDSQAVSHREGISDSSFSSGGYVIASGRCINTTFPSEYTGLKLAVLDYYWADTYHDPSQLRSALEKYHAHVRDTSMRDLSDPNTVVAELETRLYRGVFIRPEARGKDCFKRFSAQGSNATLVRRPKGGWDQPQLVYIK